MGNTLQVDKIVNIMAELSETSDMNEKFLINEFNELIELTKGNNIPYETIKELFIKLIQNQGNENINNFATNLLLFISIQMKEDIAILRPSLLYLSCLIESIYSKHCDLKQILTFSLQNIKDQSITNLSFYFPFNVLALSVSVINDQDLFSNPSADTNKFELLFYSTNLIYHIIAYPLNVGKVNKNTLEYINLFKYIFFNESFITRDVFELFYKKVFSLFLTYFDSILQYNQGSMIMSKKEQLISMLFSIIMFFCWDINQFFFGVNVHNNSNSYKNDTLCCFENDYNTIAYGFLIKLYQSHQLADIILDYNKFYQEELINLLHYNTQLFNELIVLIFNHFNKINPLFFKETCMFFIYIFELAPNFFEMVSMKEYIIVILSKISLSSLEEVILVNHIITSNNFISLIKQTQEDEDEELIGMIEKVLFKCIDLIKNDESSNFLILYLYVIISNVSLFIVRVNKRFISEFIISFKELMIYKNNIRNMSPIDKCILIKLFIETSFNFINKSELTSTYLLSLIKISEELINLYSVSIHNIQSISLFQLKDNLKLQTIIDSTEKLFKGITSIMNKIIKKIEEEGADVKFSQDIIVSITLMKIYSYSR